MKKIIFSAAILIAGFSAAHAQTTANVSQVVSLVLQNSINISVTAATGTNFTFANTSDYTNGITNATASTFLVKSNKSWTVTVNSAANFTGPVGNTMPASALGVRLSTGSTFTPLSVTAASLATGSRGSSNTFSVDYNANPGISYDAGTYTLAVLYTATQQ